MKTENKTRVIDFLNSNTTMGIDFDCFLKDEDFTTVEEIKDIILEYNGFNQEVIYYSTAIKFLAENDPSLRYSLEIASNFGFEAKDINSEMLASLLMTQMCIDEFEELTSELEDLLNEIEEEEEEQEEEEN
jgi:Ran GTPase-activating protein (RanGAP) involved in mRNA processing and transport